MLPIHLATIIDLFARAGGGGSGGGGGGGGSSGGSGGGGGGVLAVGFFISYGITSTLMSKLGRAMGMVLGGIATGVVCILFVVILRSSLWGPIEAVSAIVGFIAACFGVHTRIFNGFKKNKEKLAAAASTDTAWDETAIRQRVTDVFTTYQADWSTFNTKSFYTYSTEYFARHSEYLMMALKQLGRKNEVLSPQLKSIEFSQVTDADDNAADTFTAYIVASANDQLIDTRTNDVLFKDTSTFSEEWKFIRSGQMWVLNSIQPTTTDIFMSQNAVQAFASANKLFYREDMGWLLIPTLGEIFAKSKFGTSDINNHCIGMLKDMLVQLYTYNPNPAQQNNDKYTVVQVAMPQKAYGRVVVKRKSGFQMPWSNPSGLIDIKTESVLLNKDFRVWANSYEAASAFELLNPTYIEQLLAVPFKVNIEIYDNTLYLYSTDVSADYSTMFELLNKAFIEMKL